MIRFEPECFVTFVPDNGRAQVVVLRKQISIMKTNMGSLDRAIRIVIALVIGGLYFTNVIGGTTAIVLLVLAVVFIATSFLGFCPLYHPFGISTIRKKTTKA